MMENNTHILTTQEENDPQDGKILPSETQTNHEDLNNDPLPPGFSFDDQGLMYQPEGKENRDPPQPIFICSRLNITACTRDDDHQNHGRLLEFKDIDNHPHVWSMPMDLLAGDGTAYREMLLSMGLTIAPGRRARDCLTTYIQSAKPLARVRCVNQIGWHKDCFVLPDQTIGCYEKERLILQTQSSNILHYTTAGSLDEWRQHVSQLCVENTRLAFSLSIAFAAPLLHLLGLEGGGFHFRGPSSTGKTTALAVAASVWGGKNYIQRWRATMNGLEALAVDHNHTLLCLDELSQIDPSITGESGYMLANGSAKNRANQQGRSNKNAKWLLLFLSTGEISLADHMMEDGKKIRAGQEIRIIDIPADTQAFGVFENLHGYPNGAAFSEVLTQNSSRYHGTAAREFIKLLVERQKEAISSVKEFIKEFSNTCIPKGADGQIHRGATRFALVAAAGELATAFGITSWNQSTAFDAAQACFASWLNSRGGIVSQEELAILSQVKCFFEQHGESRFTLWEALPEHKTINRAGFKKISDEGIEYFVFPESFKKDICAGFDHKLVIRVCLKHGLLREGTNKEATRSERLPHSTSNTRCYRFTSKVLGNDVGG